ncbi:MAG: hypothetical protein WA056_06055 [Gallionella sp.]
MGTHIESNFRIAVHKVSRLIFALFILGVFQQQNAYALTINVVGPANEAVSDYRWLVEEDATKASVQNVPADASNLALSFHTSYMPVVAAGDSIDPAKSPGSLVLDAAKRYYVSVLPRSGYQMGGATIAPGQTAVTIVLNKSPVPTAQISVFVFEDNQPISGTPDLPQELGLANFSITLKEAGGTFGQSGGQVTKDAFNNPLGTTYQQNADGSFVYNPDGTPVVLALGNGFIKSGPDGVAHIKYLFPAKYTIEVIPPSTAWHQTSTIEGTKGIDAWVKANEPAFFQEFGPAGHHVDFGFVRDIKDTTVLKGTSTITGRVVNQHMSRPPNFTFYNGGPVPNCWIGLNEIAVVGGRGLYSSPCNADSTFSIPNVPAGTFQLVIWDEFLDRIIASTNVTVPPNGANVNLLDVPVFDWFGHYQASVFFDTNQNGFHDAGEMGMPEQAMNLRFRDGSIYQSSLTDALGVAKFNEVFPFFNWLVAEVDFLRYKATGATVVVDNGGPVPPHNGWTMPSWDQLNPQPQFDTDPVTGAVTATPLIGPTGNNLSRTETGPVLLQGIATFLGQTNVIEWGKANYATGENGGISGIVRYGITRAENDPRYAAPENWEPGIPRVQINLYRDCDNDGKIDQPDPAGAGCMAGGLSSAGYVAALADVDNYPFGWNDGTAVMGPEDSKRNAAVSYSKGDAVDVTWTDSWDDSLPTGCQGPSFTSNGVTTDCYDGLRNFNQVRPAVFDGGYAFGGGAGKPELPQGTYVVEAMAPKGYIHQGNGDQNVAFGDVPAPSPLALPPECVGDPLPIPQYLNLFSDVMEPNPSYDPANPGKTWSQCDRKKVTLNQGMNAPSDFYLFTEVPVAGHIVGFILDDTANEFDPSAPTFGEKHALPWLPVSVRDWSGREISRIYTDQWGTYNALVPSTYTINPPFPSGVSPNMVTTCMNDPGPIKDTRAGSPTLGQMIVDPNFSRQYSQFCYTFQYLPGKTTYLDTPVVPVAAFAGPGQFPLDCEFDDGTPVIYSVEGKTKGGVSFSGPYVQPPSTDPNIWPRLTIVSSGMVEEPNPAYDGTTATTATIFRDHGFGATQGTGNVTLNGTTLPIVSWSDGIIIASVPNGASTGQLQVTRGNGKSTVTGVTVTVGGYGTGSNLTSKIRVVTPGTKIQAAIDAANRGDMIMVPPGTYDEFVIMNKGVRLQGWGAPATHINAAKVPAEKLTAWRGKIDQLLAAGGFDLLPGQIAGFNAPNNEPDLFNTEEGPGIIVLAKSSGPQAFINTRNARIDGFTISGSDNGGGIFVNGYANYLEISNNKIVGNHGSYGGGIRLGHPNLANPAVTAANDGWYGGYTNAQNNNVRIHHNHVTQNGGSNGAGGGISLHTGSHSYKVTNNYICGNFSMGNGGGIGHLGLSNNGTIANNTVIFNETFNQGTNVSGGGIFIGGQASLAPLTTPRLSPGSGNVTVSSNLVLGNQAGAGDGGGIRAQFINGLDVRRGANTPGAWYQLSLTNNKVVNNMAGAAGGGISLQDTVKATIDNNTLADNDSTGTAGAAFMPGSPNQSTPQPAGIVSRAHSTLLFNAIGATSGYKLPYSNPVLTDNIVWHNRSFYWVIDNTTVPAKFGMVPDLAAAGQAAVYSDLAVLGTGAQGTWPGYTDGDKLNPLRSILTDTTGYDASNSSTAPGFVAEYFNGDRGQTIQQPELTTAIATAGAFDEGGNWITVRFGPLSLYRICLTPGACSLYGDYRVQPYGGIGANP